MADHSVDIATDLNLFAMAERCLFGCDVDTLLVLTHQARAKLAAGCLSLLGRPAIRAIQQTCFPERPVLMLPRDMPRRRMDSEQGKAAFFHALAHIEFVAIYLAWDIVYRFPGLPDAFYKDWLIIADEEAQHFALIREHLRQFGMDYGDLPAHSGLWWHARDTAHDVLARLAIVPRCMEARGLDVTPGMIEKFRIAGDEQAVAILNRIYQDEIGHVQRGSFWFEQLARKAGLVPEDHYKALLLDFYKGKPKGPFNREMRIIAGFTENELDWLEERLDEA